MIFIFEPQTQCIVTGNGIMITKSGLYCLKLFVVKRRKQAISVTVNSCQHSNKSVISGISNQVKQK
jgi:hypothetical protein